VINGLQNKTSEQKVQYHGKHLTEITKLKTFVEENFSYVQKGKFKKKYTSKGMLLGMTVGMVIGSANGKIAIGLSLGMLFGIVVGQIIGSNLDRKAEIENKVL
jgi:hypothetical protein